jgi:dihydropteroate synthase
MNALSLSTRFPLRATSWQLRTQVLRFGRRPLLMGIVNVTPDSFSGDGKFLDAGAAVEQALRLVDEGADLLDIGGESTRPYSDPVALADELKRVIPVIETLANRVQVPLSIDTSKAAVASAALAAGAEIINDVTALTGDPAMLSLAADSAAGICAMHMQGTPQTMQEDPRYHDVVAEVGEYLGARLKALLAAGVGAEHVCLDPGIGFGKTHQHNLTLMAHCGQLHELGRPLLVGHSRKGFLGKLLGDEQTDRTSATVGAAMSLAGQGVQVIRVHDVRPVREALLAFDAAGGIGGEEIQLAE